MFLKRNLFALILLSLTLALISVTAVQAQTSVTITINFHDLVPGDTDDLTNSGKYFLEFNYGLGNHGSGSFTTTVDALPKSVSYRAHNGTLAGDWVGVTINGDMTIDYTYIAFNLSSSGADNAPLTDAKYFLEFNFGLGNLSNNGSVLYTPVGANPSFMAHTGTLTGPWTALASAAGIDVNNTTALQTLSYRYVAFNLSSSGADDTPLTDPKYFLEFNFGQGNLFNNGGVLYMPVGSTPSFMAHTGTLTGPWTALSSVVNMSDTSAVQTLHYRYIAFNLTLAGADGTPLTDAKYFLEFNFGQGNLSNNGGVLYMPAGATPSFMAHTGTLTGPWTALSSVVNITNTDDLQTLSYRYIAFKANLYHGAVNLGDAKYFLEFNFGQGLVYDDDGVGGVLYMPVGSTPSFMGHSGTLTGPWTALASMVDTQNTSNLQTLNYQYVAFTANLFNAGQALSADKYYLEFNFGQGNLYDNDHAPLSTLYTPVGANPAFMAHTGTLTGPWTALASVGININDPGSDQTLSYEYISFTGNLHNNGNVLNNPAYYLEFNYGLGNLYADGTILHTPIGANPSFRVHTGNLAGNWVALNSKINVAAGAAANVPATPNVQTLELEYATVVFTFQPALPANLANMMSTQISYIGLVANNGVVHLPPNTNISFRAQRGGWSTTWYTQSFGSGDGTVYWGIGPTYVGPTP